MKAIHPLVRVHRAWIVAIAVAAGCAVPSSCRTPERSDAAAQRKPVAVDPSKPAPKPAQQPKAAPAPSSPAAKPAPAPNSAQQPKAAPQPSSPAAKPAPAPNPAQATTPAPAPGPLAQKPAAKREPLSGWLKSTYRMRAADGDSDHDLYAVLGLDYEDAAHPGLSAHVLGRAAVDLDGDSGALFSSINDVQDGSVDADLYEAHLDWAASDGGTSARIGRQSEYLTPEVAHFDGVWLKRRLDAARALEVGAYGGLNVTYDSSAEDDPVFGVFAEGRTWKGARARLDWMHLEDEKLLDDENDLAGLSLWQSWRAWNASAKYTRLEDKDRDLELRTRWSDDAGRTSVQLRYFELLETQTQRALFLDPFTQSLQTYFPFRQFGATAWRALTDKLDLDVGVDVRRVDDSGDVGMFNHDWERYFTTLTLRDLLASPWTLSLTGDFYDDDQSDVSALGGDLSRSFASDWRLSLGTCYSLYKYDVFAATERDDVRSWFGKLVWRCSKSWTFDVRYEFEDDDLEQYHTLRCGALCRF